MDDSGTHESDDADLQLLSRDELEARVRDRTASLENLMDTMVDVLLELDPDGRISRTNAAVTEVLGYDQETVVGKPVDFLFVDPDDNESLSDLMTEAELTERLLVDGQVTDVEVYFERADDTAVPMSLSASVMEDDDGGIAGIVCVAKDISERKAAEQQADFLHSMLRHDLGNKLQIIRGYLELLEERGAEADPSIIDEIVHSVDEAVELVENVRTLHKLEGEESLDVVDLEMVLRDCVRQYDDLRERQGIEVELSIDPSTEVVAGTLLKELFANLVENSLLHSGGSTLRIATEVDGDTLTVVVEDDGVGIPDERKSEVLERGSKGPDSDGSGLGMYLAARIAEKYGEGLEVYDSEMGGVRFEVDLDLATESE